jgi:hypothetical protein
MTAAVNVFINYISTGISKGSMIIAIPLLNAKSPLSALTNDARVLKELQSLKRESVNIERVLLARELGVIMH